MKPFIPTDLPLETIDYSALLDLIGKANRYVARYDGLLRSVVNPELLLSPLRTKEAVLSSKIEGTRATFEDVVTFDAKGKTEKDVNDLEEVLNYRKALLVGKLEMERLPLTLNVIRTIHGILMQGVRGENSARGEFRRIQNWIGPPGSALETASHVPPAVPDMMNALYSWEKYLHFEDKDVMVQMAIMHAQFEIIHPFLDGNGRLGRILIPLFLYHKGIIHEPFFYMSDYLEANRSQYYLGLKNITENGSWDDWIKFFLEGVIAQAEKTINQTLASIALYDKMKSEFVRVTNSQHAITTLDYIFRNPIFSNIVFIKESGIATRTARRILSSLSDNKVIDILEEGATSKPTIYEFRPLLRIINR